MNRLILWLSVRNGEPTLFGRWYLGLDVGPLPDLIDDYDDIPDASSDE